MGSVRVIERVLVVDDDESLLRAFRLSLEHGLRLTTFTASTAQAALRLAHEHRPHLVIVDLHLGTGSGLDLLKELRADHPGIALVMITAYGSVELAVRAVKAGADEVVEKPVTPREILARLQGAPAALEIDTPSADRALWEHVSRVLADCSGNKSETARRLRRPRSWLRRFLARTAPAN
jgi:ActR/RegA family two-component response regulator